MENLSSDHHMQVIKFLKFFRSKRDLSLDQIQADFDDTQQAQLNEDMYTREEVENLLGGVSGSVRHTARSELSSLINMTVLLLAQLFESADEQGSSLEMDTSLVEDQRLLEEVEKMRLDRAPTGGKTVKLKDTLEQVKKELMQAESDRDLAQGKLKLAGKKLKKAEKELEKLKSAAEEGKEDEEEGKEEESKADDGDLALRVKELEADLEGRLMGCKPFQNLKKMMATKNAQLRDVRERLAVYEPEVLEEED